jgi:hypothetical protein
MLRDVSVGNANSVKPIQVQYFRTEGKGLTSNEAAKDGELDE